MLSSNSNFQKQYEIQVYFAISLQIKLKRPNFVKEIAEKDSKQKFRPYSKHLNVTSYSVAKFIVPEWGIWLTLA